MNPSDPILVRLAWVALRGEPLVVGRYPIHGTTLRLGRPRREEATFGVSLDPERRMRQRSVARMIDPWRRCEIEDAMKTWFTGCAQCGALTTNAEGYCPNCEAARLARRRKGRMSRTRITAPNVRRSSSDRR